MKHYSRVRLSDHKVTIGGDHDACFSLLVGRLLHSLQHTPWNTRRPLELWLVIPIGHRVGRAVLDPVTLLPTTMADVPWTRRLMRSRTGKSTTSRGAAASASEAAGAAESTTIGRLRHLILLLAWNMAAIFDASSSPPSVFVAKEVGVTELVVGILLGPEEGPASRPSNRIVICPRYVRDAGPLAEPDALATLLKRPSVPVGPLLSTMYLYAEPRPCGAGKRLTMTSAER